MVIQQLVNGSATVLLLLGSAVSPTLGDFATFEISTEPAEDQHFLYWTEIWIHHVFINHSGYSK